LADQDSSRADFTWVDGARLGAKTWNHFLTLDDRTTQIRLAEGSLIVRVAAVDDDDITRSIPGNSGFQPGGARRMSASRNRDGNQSITTVWPRPRPSHGAAD